jgi:aminoglycoside phosphotransferase (APT) family kinase protein
MERPVFAARDSIFGLHQGRCSGLGVAGSLEYVDALETILAELRPRVREWYPDADPTAEPEVLEVDSRVVAHVIRVRVARTAGPPTTLIVKAGTTDQADPSDRPRLVPMTESSERRRLELDALRTVEARLTEVGDPGFEAVRALGILPESTALVMEEFDGQPLHRFLVRRPFRSKPALRPSTLARAAGKWLRILHDTPTSNQVVRQGTRREIVDAFVEFGSFLAAETDASDLEAIIEAGVEAAGRLPDPLPTVITHGDFAPRNILVDGSGHLAVIDLLARWQAPRFEDLAGFLVALQTSRANAATRGLLFGRTIAKLEPAFLSGYYGSEPVPRHAIRVYELLLVLDKWAARANRNRKLRGVGRIRERLIEGHFDARSRLLARRLRQGL